MDQGTMDAEGPRAVHRGRRSRRLAMVVAAQNLLVAACLLVTLYIYKEAPQPKDTINIHLGVLTVIHRNEVLKFNAYTGHNMELSNQSHIHIACPGPYIWHLDVCTKDMDHSGEVKGTLRLEVGKNATVLSAVTLKAWECVGQHRIVYLKKGNAVSFHLNSTGGFVIQNLTMGLSYLLGSECA